MLMLPSLGRPLVLFIHTHKCAGSAIIDLFRREGFQLAPGTEKRGAMPEYLLDLRNISDPSELDETCSRPKVRRFIRETRRNGVDFIATEWVVPRQLALAGRKRGIFSFTVLREPLARYVSNYLFDIERGYSRAADIWQFRDGLMYREYDYYTRLFSGRLVRDPREISDADFEEAMRVLRGLDAICILERPATFTQLQPAGVDVKRLRKRNVTRAPSFTVPEDFRSYFKEQAWRDYALYEEGLRLAVKAASATSGGA